MPTEWIPTASVPSGAVITTGRRLTPSVDRIATWGWLMIGAVRNVPNGPGFVIVNVPPTTSSADSLRVRARSARSAMARARPRSDWPSALWTTGTMRPSLVEVDGDPEVDVAVDDERVVADRGVELREVAQGLDDGPGDEGKVGEADPLLLAEPVLVRRPRTRSILS